MHLPHFLDLHLSLAREDFFGEASGLQRFPYCYMPPPYLSFIEQLNQGSAHAAGQAGEQPATEGQSGSGSNAEGSGTAKQGSRPINGDVEEEEGDSDGGESEDDEGAGEDGEGAHYRLNPRDDGMRLWKLLSARGCVEGGLLSFDSVLDACFFLADAYLVNEHRKLLRSFGGDRPTNLQEYFAFTTRLVNTVLSVPPSEETAPLDLPPQPRRGSTARLPLPDELGQPTSPEAPLRDASIRIHDTHGSTMPCTRCYSSCYCAQLTQLAPLALLPLRAVPNI